MATSSGPKLSTNNLIVALDAGNVRSYLGENTTNLMPTITSWSSYVTTPVNVTVYDFPTSVGQPKTVKQSTGAAVVGGGGNYGGFYRAGVSSLVTSGETVSVSFWVRSLSGNIACRLSNQNGAGDESNLSFSFTVTSSWTRVSNSVTLNLTKDSFFIWNANVANGVWQIADFQLEKKAYPTSYTESSRGTTWFDMSGNDSHGTLLNGPKENLSSKPAITVDGVDDAVNLPNIASRFSGGQITVVSFAKITSLVSKPACLTFNGAFNFFYPGNRLTATPGILYWDSVAGWKSGNTTTNSFIGNYYCYGWTLNSTSLNFYVNGVNDGSATVNTFSPSDVTRLFQANAGEFAVGDIGNVLIYNRALSPDEMLQVYDSLKTRYIP